MTKQPGFSERLWLDVYRLRFAANLMRNADEYVEMAQLALQAGYPAEALTVIDRGLSLSLLGNGKDAANHTALRERASKAAEKDSADLARAESSARSAREGDALVNVGFAHVTAGAGDQGRAADGAGRGQGQPAARRRGAAASRAGAVAGRPQGRCGQGVGRREGQRRLGGIGTRVVGVRAQPGRQGR